MKIKMINSIKMPRSRTVGYGYDLSMPTTIPQRDKNNLDDENEDNIDDEDNNDVLDDIFRSNDLISISANAMAPFKNVPNIKRPPNTANII